MSKQRLVLRTGLNVRIKKSGQVGQVMANGFHVAASDKALSQTEAKRGFNADHAADARYVNVLVQGNVLRVARANLEAV